MIVRQKSTTFHPVFIQFTDEEHEALKRFNIPQQQVFETIDEIDEFIDLLRRMIAVGNEMEARLLCKIYSIISSNVVIPKHNGVVDINLNLVEQ